jgi:hypothetical protein
VEYVLEGGGRGPCLACSDSLRVEPGDSHHLLLGKRQKVHQHLLRGSDGPRILLSNDFLDPWTSFVAVLDKGQ